MALILKVVFFIFISTFSVLSSTNENQEYRITVLATNISNYGGIGEWSFAAGEIPKLPLNLTLLKGASIVGVFWGTFTALEPETNKNNIKKLNQMVADGKIKPLISQTIPMKDAISAINMIGNRGVTGKVVLVNDEE